MRRQIFYNINMYIAEIADVIQLAGDQLEAFAERFCEAVCQAHTSGNKVYLCANGGNAGTMSHIACDLNMHPFVPEDKRGYPIPAGDFKAINLCESPSTLSAAANDAGVHNMFAAQMLDIRKGDILFCASGSGNSANICHAAMLAKQKGATVFGVTRQSECKLAESCGFFLVLGNATKSVFPGQTGANNCNFYFEDVLLMLGHMATGILKEKVHETLQK